MKNHAVMATYLRGTGQQASHSSHLKSHRRNNFSSVIMRQRDLLDDPGTDSGVIQEAGRGLVLADRGTNVGRKFPDTPTRHRRIGELPKRELPKIDQQLNEYTTQEQVPKAPDDIQALAKLAGN